MTEICCPKCTSYDVATTTEPDEEGYAEYRYNDCGEYFVDVEEPDLSPTD